MLLQFFILPRYFYSAFKASSNPIACPPDTAATPASRASPARLTLEYSLRQPGAHAHSHGARFPLLGCLRSPTPNLLSDPSVLCSPVTFPSHLCFPSFNARSAHTSQPAGTTYFCATRCLSQLGGFGGFRAFLGIPSLRP